MSTNSSPDLLQEILAGSGYTCRKKPSENLLQHPLSPHGTNPQGIEIQSYASYHEEFEREITSKSNGFILDGRGEDDLSSR